MVKVLALGATLCSESGPFCTQSSYDDWAVLFGTWVGQFFGGGVDESLGDSVSRGPRRAFRKLARVFPSPAPISGSLRAPNSSRQIIRSRVSSQKPGMKFLVSPFKMKWERFCKE